MKEKIIILNDDYLNKQRVLQLGLDRFEKKLHMAIYTNGLNADVSGDYTDYDNAVSMYKDAENEYGDDFVTARNLNKSRYNRIQRIREKNEFIIQSGKGIFLTLTFTDKTLNSTTEATRRIYASRFLKSQCKFYLANVDYGQDKQFTEREHYHAIVLPLGNKVALGSWRAYGNINAKRIHVNALDNLRTAKYLAKLSYHAIKNNGQLKRLIYSRNLI